MHLDAYARPDSLEAALALLAHPGAAPLAGGTRLLAQLKDGAAGITRLVDLKAVPGLADIRTLETGQLQVGALCTFAAMAGDQRLRSSAAALSQAAASVQAPAVAGRRTLGGDLCRGSRRLEDPEELTLFGAPGTAVGASLLAPALAALGAGIQIRHAGGWRTEPAASFTGRVAPGELISAVTLPLGAGLELPDPAAVTRLGSAFSAVTVRAALDEPLVSAAAVVALDRDIIMGGRVSLGHVAPGPWATADADAQLVGKPPVERVVEVASGLALAGAAPGVANGYRVRLARAVWQRAVLAAAGESPETL